MTLFVTARAGLWLDGVSVAGQDLRREATEALLSSAMPTVVSPTGARQGVRPAGTGGALLVQAASGMNITVNSGMCFVQGTTASNSGMYTACLDSTATLTVVTSDPTNPRIDNVIAQVTDTGSGSSTTVITLQTGTPAPSPVAPALPANSLLLATVTVAASTASIVSGNITDQRVFTVAQGGVLPVASTTLAAAITAADGMYLHDINAGRLRVAGGGFVLQPKIAAFAAVANNGSDTVATTGSPATVMSLNVTGDNRTEIEVFGSWEYLTPAAGTAVGDTCVLSLYLDGVIMAPYSSSVTVRADSTNLNPMGGGSLRCWAVPGSGAHTLSLVAQSTGHHFTVVSPSMRVAPSLQQ